MMASTWFLLVSSSSLGDVMNILIVGASTGLGRAFVEGLGKDGDTLVGVSRNKPLALEMQSEAAVEWLEVDMSRPAEAADTIAAQAPANLDVIIYNLGVWEERAFEKDYNFLESSDEEISHLIDVGVTAAMLMLKRLIPRLLKSNRPQIILTGSTSALTQCGGVEVAFGASKFALRGIAGALREGFRSERLAVTCLQLGNLNTEDLLSADSELAAQRGDGSLIPLHDVVAVTRTLINLSDSAYISEIVLPAIGDPRF
jgi:NAD(P)-dependent dehydrogenase (short-subunit alcohol dehydrogenase family)